MRRVPGGPGRRSCATLQTGDFLGAGGQDQRGGARLVQALDTELDHFVDTMARRIARFDKQSISEIKRLVDASSLPTHEAIAAEWDGFIGSVQRPAAQQRIGQLMQLGLQEKADVEIRLAHYTGTLGE